MPAKRHKSGAKKKQENEARLLAASAEIRSLVTFFEVKEKGRALPRYLGDIDKQRVKSGGTKGKRALFCTMGAAGAAKIHFHANKRTFS